ncbi:MAG: hypothetical protein V4538_15080 [Bacteroidota bacterium]
MNTQQPRMFKLLKTISSPQFHINEGSIFIQHCSEPDCAYTCGNYTLHPDHVENNPEWFEELAPLPTVKERIQCALVEERTEKLLNRDTDNAMIKVFTTHGGKISDILPLSKLSSIIESALNEDTVVQDNQDPLTIFTNSLREVKWDNDLFFRFNWGLTPVAGKITISPYKKHLQILPCKSTDDIGSGAGQAIYLDFQRKTDTVVEDKFDGKRVDTLFNDEYGQTGKMQPLSFGKRRFTKEEVDAIRNNAWTTGKYGNYNTYTEYVNVITKYPPENPFDKVAKYGEVPTGFFDKQVGKEQEWEIISFHNTDYKTVLNKNEDGTYGIYNAGYKEIMAASRTLLTIHSVRRLSDGEVFTVGDIVEWNLIEHKGSKPFTIKSFEINDILTQKRMFCNNNNIDICYLKKIKQ